MRLTLRTLLAYMDGILDPADREDLTRQIEASDDAADLIHRTRDTMRRVKLPAPPLEPADGAADGAAEGDAEGAAEGAFDANAVAEYLDNTAPADAVVKLELECLKSESHLAEVASCHHILTMVLGERAEIDPEARRRMYGMPEVAEALAAAPVAAPPTRPSTRPAAETELVSGVPDYLRPSALQQLVRWLPAAAAFVVLGTVCYLAFSEGGWLRPAPTEVAAVQKNSGTPAESPLRGQEPAGQESWSQDPEVLEEMPAAKEPERGLTAVELEGPPPPAESPDELPEVTDLPAAIGASVAEATSDPPPVGEASSLGETPAEAMPADAEPSPTVTPSPSAPPPVAPPPIDPTSEAAAAAVDLLPDAGAPAEDLPAEETAAPEPLPVGLLSSPQQVLLRFDETDGTWRRLPVRTAVLTQDRLLSLPTYHPTLTLDRGVSVELVDGTEVVLGLTEDGLAARIVMGYGRMVLTNTTGEPTSVILAVGEVEATLELAGRAVVAAEAGRPFLAGVDPAQVQSPLAVTLYAPGGGVKWSSDASEVAIDEPGVLTVTDGSVGWVEPLEAPLAWLDGRVLSAWERQATGEIEEQLDAGAPIWPQLMEIVNSPLKEQRALAASSSALVGHFDPFVRALGEEDLKPAWDDVIQTLRTAMARSPEAARGVEQALVEQRGPEQAAALYEMLCGYDAVAIGAGPDDWPNGAMRQLVDRLASPHLEIRVLANYNLEQITGRRRVFNPAGTPLSRERDVRIFRARLERGDLKPAESA